MSEPLLSVCLITYNQVKYIKETIDGVLMQKVNFSWELIIADDCSTDGTREIVLDYKKKYPDFIKLILRETNVGAAQNWLELIKTPNSKYIAYVEGDDYWTNPLKLQKQVDFLQAHSEYSFCFHNAKTYFVNSDVYDDFNHKLKSKSYKTKDLLIKGWIIPSASLVIRKEMLPDPFPDWYYDVFGGDYALELLLTTKGDFFYFDEIMSVYRKNVDNSMSINCPKGVEYLRKQIFLLRNFKSSTSGRNKLFINYAIVKASFKHFRGSVYKRFPFISVLKNTLLQLK